MSHSQPMQFSVEESMLRIANSTENLRQLGIELNIITNPHHLFNEIMTDPIRLQPNIRTFSPIILQQAQKQTNKKRVRLHRKKHKKKGQCSICFETIKKNSMIPKLQCGHIFHLKCLKDWIIGKSNCPLCRADIK